MTEQSRFPRSIFGRGFPEGFIAGLLEDPDAVPRVLASLREAGTAESDVRVIPGEHALRIDTSHHPSLATWPCTAGEAEVSERFVAGAMLGDLVVAIRAGSERHAIEVADVLVGSGVHYVHRFGTRWVSPALPFPVSA